MAKYNDAVSLTFNDNDGGAGWRCNPQSVNDLRRHYKIFGVWRARWIFIKRFWRGIKVLERLGGIQREPYPLWVFKPEIPE